ncbi:MAG: hypothetical protein A2W22_02055 [Candidatus Levybacteria bacterium RBG_16_35_11]|nr:MAG: hypothetical protein A2W22_02055 [Candidatus Levybacteria bacterium RBG_16_35_11]
MIPLLLRIRVRNEDHRGVNLWLPLFLLWLIVLPLLVALLPLVLLAALILWPSGKGKVLLYGYVMIFGLIGYMSGLKIDIRSRSNNIYINLI